MSDITDTDLYNAARAPVAWITPICRYISDVLASDASPSEKHIARTIMHLLPFDDLLKAPAPVVQGEPVAWMHPDGRVVPAETMTAARRDGGAMASSLRDYAIALGPLAATDPVAQADETDWRAIARLQSAKLHVALDEPGARERLQAVLQETSLDAPAPATQPLTLLQINAIEMATEWPENSLRSISPRDWGRLLVTAVRATERAHKIGGEA